MSKTETGFPCDTIVERNGKGQLAGPEISGAGMTLRDYFAAKAMPVAISHLHDQENGDQFNWQDEDDGGLDCRLAATFAYSMADAMLEAREAS